MKRTLSLAVVALSFLSLANCAKPPPPPVHVHHYHSTTTTTKRTTKPASTTTSSSPESFQAVTPPASYSR